RPRASRPGWSCILARRSWSTGAWKLEGSRRMGRREFAKGGHMSKEKNEKWKALSSALAAIEKQFGKGAVMRMGEDQEQVPVATIPTGSVGLDLALGVGGYPKGRLV